jgi:hypothetical protein
MKRAAPLLPAVLFVAAFAVFFWSPNHQMTDSGYALLTSENLIRYGDLDLGRYRLDHGRPGSNYRLEQVGGQTVYYFPLGSSILSVPYLAVDRLLGQRIVAPDGSYLTGAEQAAEARLAALLMAAFTVIAFFTARLVLPAGWSVVVALATGFGTQVFSTASRTLWSDSWALVLVGGAVHLLLRAAMRGGDRPFVWLATLEMWAYFARPTNSLALAGTGLYLLLVDRQASWKFFLTAGLWLAAFVGSSLVRGGAPLPEYFHGRLGGLSGEALIGTLLSPSRGLFVCVPATLAVALLCLRYRTTIRSMPPAAPLARLAVGVCVAHWLVVSAFDRWWGGYCFGARLCAGMVPWLMLLAILGLEGARRARSEGPERRGALLIGGLALLLLGLSVAINAVGAISAATVGWNIFPEDLVGHPDRLWSWRHAQVLAGLTRGAGATGE